MNEALPDQNVLAATPLNAATCSEVRSSSGLHHSIVPMKSPPVLWSYHTGGLFVVGVLLSVV